MARLDDAILTQKSVMTTLLHRFHEEANLEEGNGQFFALIQHATGEFYSFNPISPELAGDQMVFATDVLRLLNKELHHDGAWVILFTNPRFQTILETKCEYNRFALLWLDADGDVQFTHDWVAGEGEVFDFTDVLLMGLEGWGDQAEASWQQWYRYMVAVMAPKQDQLIKAAQGQRAFR